MNKTTVLSVLAQSTTSSPERTTTARVERACASCHRRKVKCIKQGQDINSCKRCQSDNLTCNPRQKGPKRRRAKKVSKLRENAGSPQDMDFEAQSISSTSTREHDLLPLDLVHSCVDFFSVNIYPFTPVIEHHKAFEVVEKMGRSTEAYFLIVALCAYVMIYVNKYDLFHMLNSPKFTPMSGMALCHTLLEKLERVCIFGNATYLSVLTSWFYCGIHLGLAREDIASSRLFKTIKLAQSLGMHDEGRCTPCERALYWVLLMAYMCAS
ncbi:hypothetical protein HBH71_254210 [Parastagonospora nodorum]|nr:hypothetical protein HBH71_254210 [Parastagonospora nodorum]